MFTNVIVPLDGSREATAAIPVARTLATLGGGRLSLLRVVHRPAGLFASHANQVREASAYLEDVVRQKLAGVDLPISTHVRSGAIVEAILAEVDESASSVIVMTTRGHGGVVRAVLGSVASELLGKSPVPVILVRAGARPVDFARESEQALAGAAAFEFGEYVDPTEMDRAALADARQSVNTLADRLEMQGISAEGIAMLGDVPSTITETADALRTDLIVMRTRGHTGAARAVLGSVADAVARSAAVPVMLLRGDRVSRELAAARHDRARPPASVW